MEDEAFTRKQMAKLLKRKVGQVIVAENGEDGIQLFKQHTPDIVIADMIMPVMGGLDMIKYIRKMSKSCFIIITTAIGDSDTILKTVDVGIDKYLVKPLDSDQLMHVLDDIGEIISSRQTMESTLDVNEKKTYETKLKKEFSHYLKTTTGKGPLKVTAFIKGMTIEVKAYEVLTELEKSLMEKHQNLKYVEMNRQLYYSIKQKEIEKLIESTVNQPVTTLEVKNDVLQNVDDIIFRIV